MNRKLRITVESSWRGGILDTVANVAEYELTSRAGYLGQYGLPQYEKKPIKLSNGEVVFVWASYSESNKYLFTIEYKEKEIISFRTDSAFYLEIYLPDQKQYQFKIILI